MCWPETRVNLTIFLPCPDYLNKFNKLGMNIYFFEINLQSCFELIDFLI